MKKLLLSMLVALLAPTAALSQYEVVDNSQSPPLQWKTIENEYVKVIYPEAFRPKAVYVANLIKHNAAVVGLSYGITKPKKVTLIIRNEVALPNGFVARAPRRTEWFNAGAYSPMVGSLEWLQILSIHEYRHVQQMDDFNKNTVRYFDYLLGDLGLNLADVISKKPWMAEGDAVYAETKYTDGGRGRSPRFLTRLKGILLGGETPSYDQFVNGTYRDVLVNQYVYGYVLISRAYQKYGDDFWEKLTDKITHGPHPFRLESAFKELTGVEFKTFYYETFSELREAWKKDAFTDVPKTEYSVSFNPKIANGHMYYVKFDMNTVPAIYKSTAQGEEKVIDVPYSEDLSRIDYSGTHAVYTDYVPHPRYGFEGSANLTLVDLNDGSQSYITSHRRLYNPKFSTHGKSILAAEYTDKMAWNIQEISLEGKNLRTLSLKGLDLLEAAALNADEVIAIASDNTGHKALIQARFGSDQYKVLLPFSRNNIFWLQTNTNGEALFEAQYKGANEVFHINSASGALKQCTQSRISSYAPSFDGTSVLYTEETPYGARTKKADLSACSDLASSQLVDFNYLGDNPSDNYNKFPPAPLKDQASLYTANADQYPETDYGMLDARGFTPHSWNFFGGRGLALTVMTDNYLRDFGSAITIGSDGEENTPFTSVKIDFKRYWPVVSLLGDIRNRAADVNMNTQELTWREGSYGLGVALPYTFKNHTYSGYLQLDYSAKILKTESYRLDKVSVPGSQASTYVDQKAGVLFSYTKSAQPRAILPPLGVDLQAFYEDASGVSDEEAPGSYRTFGQARLYLPGFLANNGIRLTGNGQENREGTGNYIFPTPAFNPVGYIYSRGFDYLPADRFVKGSFEYMFPLTYPDYNLGAWIYFKRLYGNLYMDHTKVVLGNIHANLNSYGAELIAQTVVFRFLPVDFGFRYIQKVEPAEGEGEIFLGTNLAVF
ncbi:hypothetical protein ACNQKP_12270 [Bdellovibrio bacteriovorus]|uniref:hypothetical protein n=1 Tax=Bdellovibrio bacteriovorus TaxID=959 RepID=UPI003AA9B4E9